MEIYIVLVYATIYYVDNPPGENSFVVWSGFLVSCMFMIWN